MSHWVAYSVPTLPVVQWKHNSVSAWISRVRELCAMDPRAMPEGVRADVVLALAMAIRSVYLALDLPPTADPVWALAAASRYSLTGGAEGGSWFSIANGRLQEGHSCLLEFRGGGGFFQRRIWLQTDATLDLAGFDRGSAATDRYWDAWSLERDTCCASCVSVAARARVPFSEVWAFYRELGQSLVDRGVDQILTESRVWTVRENTRVARENNVEDATGLIGLAAQNLARAHEPSEELAAVRDTLRQALAPAFAISPILGAFMGLAYGLAELFSTFSAVGHVVDRFGREAPAWEPSRLTGQLSPEREPTHDVPDPPSVGGPIWLPGLILTGVTGGTPAPTGDPCLAFRRRNRRRKCRKLRRRLGR